MPNNNIKERFSTSNSQWIRINQRKMISFCSIIIISLILGSSLVNADLNKSRKFLFSDVIVLQVSSDENTNIAIETFLSVYSSDECVNVIKIKTESELYSWLLTPVHASHIIFGHGSKDGLITEEKIIPWDNLRHFININKKNFVPVMACYSGSVYNCYGGVPYKIDAEAAGIYGAYYIDIDRNGRSRINDRLLSLAFLKQTLMEHPLALRLRKWISSPAAATMEVINWKSFIIQNEKLNYIDIINSNDYYWSETKNPFHVLKVFTKEPPLNEGTLENLAFFEIDIFFCINDLPFADTRFNDYTFEESDNGHRDNIFDAISDLWAILFFSMK